MYDPNSGSAREWADVTDARSFIYSSPRLPSGQESSEIDRLLLSTTIPPINRRWSML